MNPRPRPAPAGKRAAAPGRIMLDLRQPPPRPLVAASILSADFGAMAQDCLQVLDLGADLLHVDVMDGHFVPNLTMGADMVRGLRRHFPQVCLDVHMMVERPDRFAAMFAEAGANCYSFHVEVCQPLKPDGLDPRQMIDAVRACGMSVGLVINPPTPVTSLEPFLPHVDLALIMSVNPGRSGQRFLAEALPKLRWVKQRLAPATRLEIDGGINPDTARQAVQAGADVLVTASALFGAADRAAVIRQLHDGS